jgi:hypothetical protein
MVGKTPASVRAVVTYSTVGIPAALLVVVVLMLSVDGCGCRNCRDRPSLKSTERTKVGADDVGGELSVGKCASRFLMITITGTVHAPSIPWFAIES